MAKGTQLKYCHYPLCKTGIGKTQPGQVAFNKHEWVVLGIADWHSEERSVVCPHPSHVSSPPSAELPNTDSQLDRN